VFLEVVHQAGVRDEFSGLPGVVATSQAVVREARTQQQGQVIREAQASRKVAGGLPSSSFLALTLPQSGSSLSSKQPCANPQSSFGLSLSVPT
jgi:type II secretory pathway pseudopilin PulG